MFDRATCLERDKISAVPYVSASALSSLADLLLSVSRAQATSSSLLRSGASRVSRDQNWGDAHVGETRVTSSTISMERDETRLTARQRELFDNASGAAIDTPTWPNLPRETQRTLTELLARLLVDHADQNVAGCVTGIGRDL